jgi:excisionase family DNA binding protein
MPPLSSQRTHVEGEGRMRIPTHDLRDRAKSSFERILTAEEAAEYLKFTSGWLAKLRLFGGGPRFVRLGRKIRYTQSALDEWIHLREVGSTAE